MLPPHIRGILISELYRVITFSAQVINLVCLASRFYGCCDSRLRGINHSAVRSGSVGRASVTVGGMSFGSAGDVSVVGSASDEVHKVCKQVIIRS